MRRTLAVYSATSKFVDRDLSSELCHMLDAEFETVWLFSREIPKMLHGRAAHRLPGLSWFRFRVWLYLFELEKYAYRRPIFGPDQPLPHLGLSTLSRTLLAWVLRLRLSWPLRRVSLAVMRLTVPRFPSLPSRIDACLCFTAPNDPVFDDVVRYFRKRKAPIIMVPLNWDNASSKPYLESPDLVLTWGDDSAAASRQFHGIKSLALGAPSFDTTRVPAPPSSFDAKAFLGLSQELNYVLFAGSSFPFDEIGALNTLSTHLKRHSLCQYRIIYRPHPVAWARSRSSELSDDSKQFVCPDPTSRLFQEDDLRQYQFLFKSVCGLITPYSTMLIEAAMYGIPALAVGYNSQSHPEFDWSANSRHQPHLRFTKTAPWIVECHDEAQLPDAFVAFLDLFENRSICAQAKTEFERLVRVTNRSYGEELIEAIMKAISNATPDADLAPAAPLGSASGWQ